MIRRHKHDRDGAQQWTLLLYFTDNRQTITWCNTKEEAEEHMRLIDSTFDLRYAYITEVKEAFYAGRA